MSQLHKYCLQFKYRLEKTFKKALSSWKIANAEMRHLFGGLNIFRYVLVLSPFFLLASSEMGDKIVRNFARKVEFPVREYLNLAPPFSNKLVVFVYDDKARAFTNSLKISYSDWGKILKVLDARKPRAILIDKIFDYGTQEEHQDFLTHTEGVRTPIYSGVFLHPLKIKGMTNIPIDSEFFKAHQFFLKSKKGSFQKNSPNWLGEQKLIPYGAKPMLRSKLNASSHFNVEEMIEFYPMFKIAETSIVPHLSINYASPKISDLGIQINGHLMPVRPNGRVTPNLPKFSEFKKKAYGMKALISRARKSKSIPIVNEGDLVFIIPAYYTGHADWVTAPIGHVPGGYSLAANINSSLTGNWFHYYEYRLSTMAFISVLLLFLSKFIVSNFLFNIFSFSLIPLLISGGILACSFGFIISWLFPAFITLAASYDLLGQRLRISREAELIQKINSDLSNTVQNSMLPADVSIKNLSVAHYFEPADAVGGDYYYYFKNNAETHAVFLLADITGHGSPSALVSGIVCGALRERANGLKQKESISGEDLLSLFSSLNSVIFDTGKRADRVLSMIGALINLQSGETTLTNAAHNFPLLFTSKKTKMLRLGGTHVGSSLKTNFNQNTLQLKDGEAIMLYSDGLVENCGPDKETLTEKDLTKAKFKSLEPDHVIEMLISKGQSIWKRHPAGDDVSVLMFRWKKPEEIPSGQLSEEESKTQGTNYE